MICYASTQASSRSDSSAASDDGGDADEEEGGLYIPPYYNIQHIYVYTPCITLILYIPMFAYV
jgi:hypothetical protein